MDVEERVKALLERVRTVAVRAGRKSEEITIVAVTKGHPLEHVLPAYKAGLHHFGENRLQEALSKMSGAPRGVQWHLIGTLQRNKVAKAIGRFAMIHSVDTIPLAEKISSCSAEAHVTTKVLLQVNVSGEESKQGFTKEECRKALPHLLNLPGISIQGFMTMAPLTEDRSLVRSCFRGLSDFRKEAAPSLPHLSMGMSSDYEIAIEEGATLIRVGRELFTTTLLEL